MGNKIRDFSDHLRPQTYCLFSLIKIKKALNGKFLIYFGIKDPTVSWTPAKTYIDQHFWSPFFLCYLLFFP